MLLFMSQCEGTINGPMTNDTATGTLGDWLPKATSYTPTTSRIVATLTGVPTSAITESSSSSSQMITSSDKRDTVLSSQSPSSSQTISAESAAPKTQDSKPVLNVAAIIGVAVGGAVLLALVTGLIAFFLRRRKRDQPTESIPQLSNYDNNDNKERYDKPELDGQELQYRCSEIDTVGPISSPVVYAELDGNSPMDLARELPAVTTWTEPVKRTAP